MENHFAGCETCSRFAKVQRTLDSRLGAAVPQTRFSPAFPVSIEEKDSM